MFTELKSGIFDPDDTISLNAAPFCCVCMDYRHRTCRCRQIRKLTKFVRTQDKHFMD